MSKGKTRSDARPLALLDASVSWGVRTSGRFQHVLTALNMATVLVQRREACTLR